MRMRSPSCKQLKTGGGKGWRMMLQEALNRYRLDGHLYSSSWDALGKNPLLNMLDLTSWGHVSGATIAHALISQAFLENKKKTLKFHFLPTSVGGSVGHPELSSEGA